MADRLNVVLCWHMHQPCYRDALTGVYALPWTYLHAIKDYVDMAAHLEDWPAARAVVNFTPTLLEQLSDYETQIDAHLAHGAPIRDPVLAALAAPSFPVDAGQRSALMRSCLRAHERNLIQRFPAYARLADTARRCVAAPELCDYLNDRFLADLITWYHLAWLGESVRRGDARIQAYLQQAHGYTPFQRRELMAITGDLVRGIVPRYRRLADSGQVELSVTPYAHPIAPLLIDFQTAREAMPAVNLPQTPCYGGGEERVRWHFAEALRVFHGYFARTPAGCWPAEGSLSRRTLEIMGEFGFQWTAGGQGVLNHSLARQQAPSRQFRPYRLQGTAPACFFRDDGLSDRIGFDYARWHSEDAVSDLIGHLHAIGRGCTDPGRYVVAIIMDGENAWDHYAENGWYFLKALYRRLSADERLAMTTFGQCLQAGMPVEPLGQLVAGSWIYGTFSTWVGEFDKNRAWDLLAAVKRDVDEVLRRPGLPPADRERIERQLAICEGSDWFWWFGTLHSRETVQAFDQLYRGHLRALYGMLNRAPPSALDTVISEGRGDTGPDSAAMQRT